MSSATNPWGFNFRHLGWDRLAEFHIVSGLSRMQLRWIARNETACAFETLMKPETLRRVGTWATVLSYWRLVP